MLPKALRLPYSHTNTFTSGVRVGVFRVLSRASTLSHNRFMVIIPKCNKKKAVVRHKYKRILMAMLSTVPTKGRDYIITLTRPVSPSDFQKEVIMLSSRL